MTAMRRGSGVALLWLVMLPACSAPQGVPGRVVTLKPELQVGAQARPGQEFGGIADFGADSAGRLFVADLYTQQVLAFDTAGRLIWREGRQGRGPGEYEAAHYVGAGFGEVVVVDGDLDRATVLDARTGRVIRTVRFNADMMTTLTNGRPIRLYDGEHVVFGVDSISTEPDPDFPGQYWPLPALLVLDLRTGAQQRFKVPFRGMHQYRFSEQGTGFRTALNLPFVPWQVWTPAPDSGWATVGWGGRYALADVRPLEDTVRTYGRHAAPLPLSGAAIERAQTFMLRMLRMSHADRAGMAHAKLPGHQPDVVALSYSADGRELWVLRTQYEANPVYDVFVDHAYRCTVRLDMRGNIAFDYDTTLVLVNGRAYAYARARTSNLPLILVYDLNTSKGFRSACGV